MSVVDVHNTMLNGSDLPGANLYITMKNRPEKRLSVLLLMTFKAQMIADQQVNVVVDSEILYGSQTDILLP